MLYKGIVCPTFLTQRKNDVKYQKTVAINENKFNQQHENNINNEKSEISHTKWKNLTTTYSESTLCDFGWAPISLNKGEYCYFFNMTTSPRHQAAMACSSMNATLPLPSTPHDDTVLQSVFQTKISAPKYLNLGSVTGLWINAMLIGIGQI